MLNNQNVLFDSYSREVTKKKKSGRVAQHRTAEVFDGIL